MAEKTEEFNELVRYLEKEIRQHQISAQIKNIIAQLLYFIVIAISGISLINTGTSWLNPKELTIIAALPGLILIISNTFKFEARSKWNKLKQRKLDGLLKKLKFEGVSVEQISKEVTDELEKLDAMRVQLEKPITK